MFSLKQSLIFLSAIVFGASLWLFSRPETKTLTTLIEPYAQAGVQMQQDLSQRASLPIHEVDGVFRMEDDGQQGIQIAYANEAQAASEAKEAVSGLSLSFPQDLTQPLEIKLDAERIITLTDQNNHDLTPSLLSDAPALSRSSSVTSQPSSVIPSGVEGSPSIWKRFLEKLGMTEKEDDQPTYLSYQNSRKTILYTLKKDQATNEKQLKSWTLYQKGNGIETEAYRIDHAQVKINEAGQAELFYQGDQDLKNEAAKGEVEPSLLERAQRTLEKELGEDILNGNHAPDLIIPKPFFYDKEGEKHEAEWKIESVTSGDTSVTQSGVAGSQAGMTSTILSLELTFSDALYPIALDPTLQFTAPAISNTGGVITGESASRMGAVLVSGDFNADGKTDLAMGATGYSSDTGRVYVFYNNGALPSTLTMADLVITGPETFSSFSCLVAGDFNADGRTDLVVGARAYGGSGDTGRVYIFYNDGSIPTTAATADVTITGETTNNLFGRSLASGDLNADGTTDLAVGASGYSSDTGRAYIFYNDGSIPTTAATADVTITGEATSDSFGFSLATGDLNADGRIDLAIGASGYSSLTGRVYLFYNDGSIPTTAATADVTITGEATGNFFGTSLTSGDLNADGTTDLAVGAYGYSTQTGRVYIFYNDGSIPTTAATADIKISGQSSSDFGRNNIVIADFNTDGRADLAVGAWRYSTTTGRAYIFYNDGSIPTTAATADVIITGEGGSYFYNFGSALFAGDWNSDGNIDLAVGASAFDSNSTGRTYIFYSQNGQVNTNQSVVGETTNNYFSYSLTSGDFNADGRTDLAVGAYGYSTNTGRTYIFYNDGSIPTTATTADVIITGETTSNYFGAALASGDFNADGKTDLVVGAYGYSSGKGRTYLFYNDGSIPTTAATADVTITGETTGNSFGTSLTSGDLNADGKTDLAVGASGYSSNTGRAYIFYNDGSIPTAAGSADVKIDGESSSYFGDALASGDLNADGKTDLIAGVYLAAKAYIFYNDGSIPTTAATADVIITGTVSTYFGTVFATGDLNADGRVDLVVGNNSGNGSTYIFYNDGSIPTTAATADVNIAGEGSSGFGSSLAVGDFNADGTTDLAVGASGYSTNTGRAYIFYNDGSIPTTAATADVIITGETTSNFFGYSLTAGDLNADGKTDLAVGAYGYSTNTGNIYFYETRENFAWQLQPTSLVSGLRVNPGVSGQELKITGEEASSAFGTTLASGDWNADGKTDLAVGATGYSTSTGRIYLFYTDGTLPASATSADVVITGEATNNYFGSSLTAGDLNADGKTDLAVGAYGYSTNTGRAYIFYNDGSIPTTAATADVTITGETTGNYFGYSIAAGDLNSDGTTDLVTGSYGYSSSSGRVYLFYNDGSIPTTAATADVIITGSGGGHFGTDFALGDWNADGSIDILVSSPYAPRYRIFYNDGSYPTTEGTADVSINGVTFSAFDIQIVGGDMNADGKIDIVISESTHSTNTGRVFLIYNDGSYPAIVSSADVIITGGATSNYFGYSLAAGDWNADGKTDLAVGGSGYSSNTGRAYIFYNDGSIPTTAATADVTITGETAGDLFGTSLTSGDLNADGKTDLAVGAYGYSSSKGRTYVYTWNDGVITGETTNNNFGYALTTGDLNADGKTDLAVGAYGYSTNTGRAYLFYNDGSIPTTAATADVTITGETTDNYFGSSLTTGDLNADGKTDLVVGAYGYSSSTGRAYLFYNDGSIPTTAATADVIITGETTSDVFGYALTTGDLNADGKTDLAVGAYGYSTNTGRAYLFYNDGSIPTTAATADVIITGETTDNYFGSSLTTGDLNADGKTDLAVGATGYSTDTGRAYIFSNDGSIPTTAATADVIITGETTSDVFGYALTTGDLNADGKTDLAVGAYGYSTNTGRAYLFYNDGSIPTTAATADVTITGETTDNYFGSSLTTGDLNADGKTDLAVGAYGYSTNTGRAYLFYNDGSIPTTAATADVTITGETTSNYFGNSLTTGDLNADGKTDLAVGAYGYSSGTGRAYIIMTEAETVDGQEKATVRKAVKFRGPVKLR